VRKSVGGLRAGLRPQRGRKVNRAADHIAAVGTGEFNLAASSAAVNSGGDFDTPQGIDATSSRGFSNQGTTRAASVRGECTSVPETGAPAGGVT